MSYNNLQEIVDIMLNPDIKIISFDLFDTLVLRPVPGDKEKFELLDKLYGELTNSQINFAKVRTLGEATLRRQIINGELKLEDVELDSIYQVIEDVFKIPHNIAQEIKDEETKLELALCSPRESGKYLYEKALETGKKVILISDIYYSKDMIMSLLEKNGYTGFHEVFVSAHMGLRKITGNLYKKVIEEMNVAPSQMLHIGDNLESDCEIAKKLGINTVYLPSTLDVFNGYGCLRATERLCSNMVDWEKASKEVGMSVFRKMAANKYFDNPFREFSQESNYNVDPYFVGYGALGLEVLGLVKWLSENIARDNVEEMVFLSRDGHLPMQVYEMYRKYHPKLPKASYLHVSRIALLPAMIRSPQDLFDLPVDISYQTPAKLIKLLTFCINDSKLESVSMEFDLDRVLDTETFHRFISYFIENLYDEDKHKESINDIRKYLTKHIALDSNVALFDSGYSGRILGAISYVLGKAFPAYFVHGDGLGQFLNERRNGLNIRCFLDYNPYMEASLREYAYLEVAPSCVGYDTNQNPIFDIGPANGYEKTVNKMQKGAIDFVADFLKHFGEYEEQVSFRNHSAAMPFEAFLRYCSKEDIKMFEGILIDDELWGGRRDIDLKMLMEARLRKLPPYAR
ncbi:MAG: hypothetical protein E7263_03770 [Lachnospiraceae bacterium]|nr:hypothetical protein [Lachnospiraceae bacterium]